MTSFISVWSKKLHEMKWAGFSSSDVLSEEDEELETTQEIEGS